MRILWSLSRHAFRLDKGADRPKRAGQLWPAHVRTPSAPDNVLASKRPFSPRLSSRCFTMRALRYNLPFTTRDLGIETGVLSGTSYRSMLPNPAYLLSVIHTVALEPHGLRHYLRTHFLDKTFQ